MLDADFEDTALQLNAVLRWEYLPGSTLMAVYTRNEQAARTLGESPSLRLHGLTSGPTEDVVLLKLVYTFR